MYWGVVINVTDTFVNNTSKQQLYELIEKISPLVPLSLRFIGTQQVALRKSFNTMFSINIIIFMQVKHYLFSTRVYANNPLYHIFLGKL